MRQPQSVQAPDNSPALRLVAWEVTRTCNLHCQHCRAASAARPYRDELSAEEAKGLINDIESFSTPVLILTGGEPLLRPDIFEIASHASHKGLRVVMATNGTLLTPHLVKGIQESGVKRVSISIDGASAQTHDEFRGVQGAFDAAMRGIRLLRNAGVHFQINSSITHTNIGELPALLELSQALGAVAHHIFMVVPTGRAAGMKGIALTPERYESALRWLWDQHKALGLHIKATCAPQYYRIMRQYPRSETDAVAQGALDAVTSGCLGGKAFCFISHVGQVQPCGYLDVDCGNVRRTKLKEIWERSEVFTRLRHIEDYSGRCARCAFNLICGGCRARAYAESGDFTSDDPYCLLRRKKCSCS